MKKIRVSNYKSDTTYARIVESVQEILASQTVVAPVEIFIRMNLLSREEFQNWRFGRIPYLEKVIRCNLSVASRILRILRFHAHDLNMVPSPTAYVKWGKGQRRPLCFSKTGEKNIEEAYSRHFISPAKKGSSGEKKAIENKIKPEGLIRKQRGVNVKEETVLDGPCPCGSGDKYEKCCYGKEIKWEKTPDGTFVKSVPMDKELQDTFNQQRKKFVKQFGREPGPDDEIFFDSPPLEHIEHGIVQAMKSANISPAIIYAFEKTGLLVSEENKNKLSGSDLNRWGDAIEEYHAQNTDKEKVDIDEDDLF